MLTQQSSRVYSLRFTLAGVTSVGLGKHTVSRSHHRGIIPSAFTALKILWALPAHPFTPATAHLLSVSVKNIVWLESHSMISEWFPSRSDMHVKSPSLGLSSSFLFSTECDSIVWMGLLFCRGGETCPPTRPIPASRLTQVSPFPLSPWFCPCFPFVGYQSWGGDE